MHVHVQGSRDERCWNCTTRELLPCADVRVDSLDVPLTLATDADARSPGRTLSSDKCGAGVDKDKNVIFTAIDTAHGTVKVAQMCHPKSI